MGTFSHRNQSTAVVPARRADIFALLADPEALAAMTPMVSSITAEGDTWRWQLVGISAMGVCITPTFTEQMTFDEPSHIGFAHRAPAGSVERASASGTYDLRDVPGGTELSIDITLEVEVPLPGLARKAVEKVMASMMARTGEKFARNLYDRLGLDPALAEVPAAA